MGGWVANSSQMSSGAEAQELLCFQSLEITRPPHLPLPLRREMSGSLLPVRPLLPAPGRKPGTGRKGGALALRAPCPASSARRCRGPGGAPRRSRSKSPSERGLARSVGAFEGWCMCVLQGGFCFVLFLESPLELRRPDGSNQNPITTEEEGRKSSTEFSGQSVYGGVCERTCLSKLGDKPWVPKPHHSRELSCLAWRSMGTAGQSVPQPLMGRQLL